jgi:hypothetical protein
MPRYLILTTAFCAALSVQDAAARGFELNNPDERLEDINYGLTEVCLAAQKAGMSAKDYIRENVRRLTLVRYRDGSSTTTDMWKISGGSDVAVAVDDKGCTVSTSFEFDDRDDLVPILKDSLSSQNTRNQMLQGDAENDRETRVTAYCRPTEGGQDGFVLYEYLQLDQKPGQFRPLEVQYLSVVVPNEPFCAQG